MVSSFWTHTIWYVLLGIVTVAELALVLCKTNRRGLAFAFFLTVFGITLYVETTLLIYLKSYSYSPMILNHSLVPYDDVLLGNLFSQVSISATLLLAAVLHLRVYWYFLFAVMYGLIEELFLALGIYNHNWYRTWMTVTMLPVAFFMIRYMYGKLINGIKPLLYYGFVFIGLFPLNIATLTWFLMLTGIQETSRVLFADPIISRHSVVLLVYLPLFIGLMLVYFLRLKLHWKALAFFLLFTLYYIAYRLKLLVIKGGWFLPVSLVTIFWVYFSIMLLDKLYGEPLKKPLKS